MAKKGHYMFIRWFKHPKTGQIINASDYGKKAFRIWVNN